MKSFEEMQDAFYDEVRQELLRGLGRLPQANHRIFKLMYANEHLDLPIEKVVAKMERDRLDWAMQQVQRTIDDREY